MYACMWQYIINVKHKPMSLCVTDIKDTAIHLADAMSESGQLYFFTYPAAHVHNAKICDVKDYMTFYYFWL